VIRLAPIRAVIAPLLALFATCALAACGDPDAEPGPGGVTAGEARALDEAAEMLDQQRLPDEALSEPGSDSPEPTASAAGPTGE
jgi:hypothetical protein